jgi:hypothetical protein
MALLHQATLTPTKPEALAAWLPSQPWAPDGGDLELVGAFRFDDPEGQVGLEVHLVRLGGVLLQVPFTYRGAPLEDAEDHLVTTMEHTALGSRWVYDGLHDPTFTTVLAAAALTGTGQAVGVVERDGRVAVVPSAIRIAGGGWTGGPVLVDGFRVAGDDDGTSVLRNDGFELRVARRPEPGPTPAIGLTATWDGAEPVVLVEVDNS